jgi:hypothetical protein
MHRRSFLALACTALAAPARVRAAVGPVALSDLYGPDGAPSPLALSLEGQAVRLDGFMAPPLKPEARFFVLTEQPMATCPFCAAGTAWPAHVVTVQIRHGLRVIPFNRRLAASGTLALAPAPDEENDIFSRVRLVDASYQRL